MSKRHSRIYRDLVGFLRDEGDVVSGARSEDRFQLGRIGPGGRFECLTVDSIFWGYGGRVTQIKRDATRKAYRGPGQAHPQITTDFNNLKRTVSP